MYINIAGFFLGVSVLLYCLLGGADFGAGILEWFTGHHRKEHQQELITHAMGPVWEANHMWLILALVILFNGFPLAYTQMSVSLHIPLTIMLIGIVLRGSAFTFRHYDAVKDRSQLYYTVIFKVSSLVTSFFLGIIAGALTLGRITSSLQGQSYYQVYLWPWLNMFCVGVGILVCVLFGFLASVYLIGETRDRELSQMFVRRAMIFNVLAVLSGILVFGAAELDGFPLASAFISDPFSLTCMTFATLILLPLWYSLIHRFTIWSRVLAATQCALVLLGWFKIQFPILIARDGPMSMTSLTLYNSAAPEITLKYLFYALAVGIALILPALFYLLKVFKGQEKSLKEV